MRFSLSFKIIFAMGLALFLCIFLMGLVEFHQTRERIEEQLAKDIDKIEERLSRSLAMPLWNIDRDTAENIVITEMQEEYVSWIMVREKLTGKDLIAKGRDDNWNVIDIASHEEPLAKLSSETPIVFQNQALGSVKVAVTDAFARAELAKRNATLVAKLTIMLFLVLGVLIFLIKRLISTPLLELSQNCQKVARGDYSVQLQTSRKDEVGSLARSFADMHEEISKTIAALNTEIAERKRSETELESLRTYLGNIIDSMPSILFTVDADKKIQQWNLMAEKRTGVDRRVAYGKFFSELLPGMSDMGHMVDLALDQGNVQNEQRLPMAIMEEERIVDLTIYPLMAIGSEGAVIRLDDVTERVKIEEVMVQTEKMMSVGGLAAGMAHEINNPLAGIMQSTQVIQNRLLPAFEKNRKVAEQCGITMEQIDCYHQNRDIKRMLGSIMESGERASRIIANMLSFSRKSTSRFIPGSLRDLLDRTLDLAANDYDLKKNYDFRNIEIIKNYDITEDLVPCDGGAIQQVFLNILKNAAQAMTAWGKTSEMAPSSLEKPTIILRTYRRMDYLCVDFEDNGIGMDEKTTKRVFEPFFSTKEVGVGTGLGLSVSYFIINENHKGKMEVESAPGKGTTFTVCLPLEAE